MATAIKRWSKTLYVNSSKPVSIDLLPDRILRITVRLIPEIGATASVYTSINDYDEIKSDINSVNINWKLWPHGIVSEIKDDVVMGTITALKFSLVTGTQCKILLLADLDSGSGSY